MTKFADTAAAAARPARLRMVGEVMTTGVVAAHSGAVFKEIVTALARNGIGAVPVIDMNRKVIGVVSESDLLYRAAHLGAPGPLLSLSRFAAAQRRLHGTTARELMSAPVITATVDMPITDAAWTMARRKVRHLPVVDDDGVLIGMLSRGDLLRGYLREDEDIADDLSRNLIDRSLGLDPAVVTVAVREGRVTISGTVPDEATVDDLVAAARFVPGVVDVDTTALTWS